MLMDLARRALAFPSVYDTYQSLVGAPQCHERFIRQMVCPCPGERVLDIGCGVGASVKYVPHDSEYVGIDVSESYIARARSDYKNRGQFICADIASVTADMIGYFDRAFSFGVLHHLSDETVEKVVALVRRVVKPGGRFVTIDPCYVPDQHPVARLLIANDRGEHIRDQAGFERAVLGLGKTTSRIYDDLLKIPYTQIVMNVELAG
jgi:SAM-dependent methyltransferase